mmetsp:Transcript_12722/g.12570  ORF Transcript_12722/g.12570 Transcript_12722/m.12570 type:complete len:119 (-) Transcript_12722:29-385(-)
MVLEDRVELFIRGRRSEVHLVFTGGLPLAPGLLVVGCYVRGGLVLLRDGTAAIHLAANVPILRLVPLRRMVPSRRVEAGLLVVGNGVVLLGLIEVLDLFSDVTGLVHGIGGIGHILNI